MGNIYGTTVMKSAASESSATPWTWLGVGMGKHTDHLTVDERNEIHRCLNLGMSLRAIARGLDRPPSAVSREVRRNAVGRHYDAGRAQQAAQARGQGAAPRYSR